MYESITIHQENIDSDAVNELDTYIMNNEDLYRRRFMPIISNIKRKLAKNVYDHEKAQTLMDVPGGRCRERIRQGIWFHTG